MKTRIKRLVSLLLLAALVVGVLPTGVLAAHTQIDSYLGTAQLHIFPEENDQRLAPEDEEGKWYGITGDTATYVVPITETQRTGAEPIEVYSKAVVTMPRLVSGALLEQRLDVSRTKFIIFMAVSKNMDVATTDFVFNSTFLQPDEDAMEGITVTRIENPYGDETYHSDHAIDMYWKLSGDIESLNTGIIMSESIHTPNFPEKTDYLRNRSYLSYLTEYESNTASGISEGKYVGKSWAENTDFQSIKNALAYHDVNVYAIPVKMNWEEMIKEAEKGTISLAPGYTYNEGDETKVDGGNIYYSFSYEDWECPMQWNALPNGTDPDGIKLTVNATNVKNSEKLDKFIEEDLGLEFGWNDDLFDRFIPTDNDLYQEEDLSALGWYYNVDAMPLAGLIVGAIFNYQDTDDDGELEFNLIAGNDKYPTTIEAGTILTQFALATPGTIHVAKTIEGLKSDAEMPDSLAVTIVDQNGNPARDLQGNVVTASIEKRDWTYEDGKWTAAIDVAGLRPCDDTYGWDYQYTVTVEEETPFSGYKQEQEPQYTTNYKDLVLENQYTLGRGEAGKITYDANPETPAVTVNVTSSYSTTDVTLTYNANGGSGDDVVKTYPLNNNTVTLLDNSATNFTREGYTFTGWADAAGRTYKPGETLTLTANLTPYAQWSRDVAWAGRPVDKTATDRDRDYQSNVTLTLPAEGYQKEVDVVFAIDCSSVLENNADEMAQALTQMAEELIAKDNVLLNVGVVGYGHNADVLAELQGVNADTVDVFMENLEEAFLDSLTDDSQIDHDGGSNVQVGIRTARELLDNSATGALPENRHLILMTDGAGFYYCRSETDDTSVCTVHNGDKKQCIGNMDANADIGGSGRMNDSMYIRLTKEGKNFADFITEQGAAIEASAANSFSQEEADDVTAAQSYTTAQIQSFEAYPYLNMERGTYFAAQELLKAKNAGYKVITIGYTYKHADTLPSLGAVSSGFLAWTGTIGEYYDGNADIDTILGSISNTLGQFVDAGSRVIDEIGYGTDSKGNTYNFDFVNDSESLSLTVCGVKLTTTEVNTNTYSFGTSTAQNQFVLTYYKNGVTLDGTTYGECFVWDINVPVTVDAPVELTYSVELTNPQKAPGTYENLHTNNSAILYPVDSDGRPVTPVEFPDPTVSYKVSWPIIIPEVPDDTIPNWLNLDDHYAYIIGYDDGTVKPQNNITRAEVATIFFRLLTDEAREYFWSTDSGFSDVKSSDWYNNAVSTMVNAGIITGYNDGTFRPNDLITRAEFATIAARFLSDPYSLQDRFYDTEGHWAEVYINRAAEVGWINGYNDGSFRPDKAITRAEAMTLVNAVLGREPHKDHLLPNMIIWPDNPKTAWYYEEIQEATNSHDYDWASSGAYEIWTALLENRQWAKLEKEWSNAYSAPGGEVMQ